MKHVVKNGWYCHIIKSNKHQTLVLVDNLCCWDQNTPEFVISQRVCLEDKSLLTHLGYYKQLAQR